MKPDTRFVVAVLALCGALFLLLGFVLPLSTLSFSCPERLQGARLLITSSSIHDLSLCEEFGGGTIAAKDAPIFSLSTDLLESGEGLLITALALALTSFDIGRKPKLPKRLRAIFGLLGAALLVMFIYSAFLWLATFAQAKLFPSATMSAFWIWARAYLTNMMVAYDYRATSAFVLSIPLLGLSLLDGERDIIQVVRIVVFSVAAPIAAAYTVGINLSFGYLQTQVTGAVAGIVLLGVPLFSNLSVMVAASTAFIIYCMRGRRG